MHNKPTGCGASGAYAPGPDEEEEECSEIFSPKFAFENVDVIIVQKTEYCAFVRSFIYLDDILSQRGNFIAAVSHMLCHFCFLYL